MDESLLLILRLSWIILLVFSFFLYLFLPPWAPPVHQHESLLLFLFHFLSLSLLRTFRRNCSLSPPTLHLFIAYCCRLCLFASIRKKKIQLFFFSCHVSNFSPCFLPCLPFHLCLWVFFSLLFSFSTPLFITSSSSLLPSHIHTSLMPVSRLPSLCQLVDTAHIKTAHHGNLNVSLDAGWCHVHKTPTTKSNTHAQIRSKKRLGDERVGGTSIRRMKETLKNI